MDRKLLTAAFLGSSMTAIVGAYYDADINNQRCSLRNTLEIQRLEEIDSERSGADLSAILQNPQVSLSYHNLTNERSQLLSNDNVAKNRKRLDYLGRIIVAPLLALTFGLTGAYASICVGIASATNNRRKNRECLEPSRAI